MASLVERDKIELGFVHIPRTAGTTCLWMLHQAFGTDNVLHIHEGPSADANVDEFIRLGAQGRQVVAGHIEVSNLTKNAKIREKLERGDKFILSVVRDPIERAFSLFNYHNSASDPNLDGKFISFAEGYPANRQFEYLNSDICDPFDLVSSQYVYPIDAINEELPSLLEGVQPERSVRTGHIDIRKRTDRAISAISEDVLARGIGVIEKKSSLDRELYAKVLSG